MSTSGAAMRILLVTPDYPPTTGGIQTLLHQATTCLAAAEVRVLTPMVPGWQSFDSTSAQLVRRLRVPYQRPAFRNAFFNAAALTSLWGWKPDLVISGHIVASPAGWLIATRHNASHVLYAYGREVASRPLLAKWALQHSDAAIAISNYTRGQLLSTCRDSQTPVFVVPPGVDVPETISTHSAVRPTVLTVARLRDWYKGHDRMIEAVQLVRRTIPDVHWVVIGDGKIRHALELRVRAADLEGNVSFLGSVDDDVKQDWLSRAHVFAMPSRYPKDEAGGEGFGIVYLEAGARGLPSVASNIGAPAEVILHEKTGLLVDPDDPNDISQALTRLLTDPSSARTLGLAARRRVEEEFTWEVVGEHLRSVLDEVVEVR